MNNVINELNNDENISDEDMIEEKSSKIYKYDSSYFSKKMGEVEKRPSNQQAQNVLLQDLQTDSNGAQNTLTQKRTNNKYINLSIQQEKSQTPNIKTAINNEFKVVKESDVQ